MKINPVHAIDWYKASHIDQYPKGTELVYSNFTPRSNKLSNLPFDNDGIVFFGLQYYIQKHLIEDWNENFFNQPLAKVLDTYRRRARLALGKEPSTDHIEALHNLGYLPIEIRALPEGTYVPIGVPVLTIKNTLPEFFWLTNYLEGSMSNMLWKACTSATTARWYKKLVKKFADETCDNDFHIPFQCHDFSFRGMSGLEDAAMSGAAHLTAFVGTDTVLAIDLAEQYYFADAEKEMLGVSVPATEHSVMCMGTKEGEIDTFRRLITETYPEGIVSIVSDTWDFWKVIGDYIPRLRKEILSRSGDMSKVVIRPDSGDPVDIICGTGNPISIYSVDAAKDTMVSKGAIECLWDIFGGTINSKGYKVLNPKIGLIYGDSITPPRAHEILLKLKMKGFASSNVVFGVGSYTYTYVTRDTYGFAVKATAGVVNGEYRPIFKDPKTDSGTKKSLKGFLAVVRENDGVLRVHDGNGIEPIDDMTIVFQNGLNYTTDFSSIRKRIDGSLPK